MYEVTMGSMVKESGNWNTDGMRETNVWRFRNFDDAMEFFDSLDLKDKFETEWSCATVKPHDRGFYAEIRNEDDDFASIDFKEYTADDWSKVA